MIKFREVSDWGGLMDLIVELRRNKPPFRILLKPSSTSSMQIFVKQETMLKWLNLITFYANSHLSIDCLLCKLPSKHPIALLYIYIYIYIYILTRKLWYWLPSCNSHGLRAFCISTSEFWIALIFSKRVKSSSYNLFRSVGSFWTILIFFFSSPSLKKQINI